MDPRDIVVEPGAPDRAARARPTMRDVAALAGVSFKTVSRVINGEPGVSAALAARVDRAADQLDYVPNLTASSLRRADGRTATIGLLLEDIANPFSAALFRSVEDVARERQVVAFAASLDEDHSRERELAAAFVARRVDGLIMMPAGHDHGYLLKERRAGIALVFVDRPPAHLDADVVLSDNRAGAETAVRHLLDAGHRRIAYLGDLATIPTARERYAGYVAALVRAGIEPDPAVVRHDLHTTALADVAASGLLAAPHPPSAIFASQNLVTIGLIRVLQRAGLAHSVALVGFDDFPLADLVEPGVTVIAQDPSAMGRLAAEIVFRRIDGDRSPTERYVIPTRLIARGSGEIAAATG